MRAKNAGISAPQRKSAGPLPSPGAAFSNAFGSLAFGQIIVSRARSLSCRPQLASQTRLRPVLRPNTPRRQTPPRQTSPGREMGPQASASFLPAVGAPEEAGLGPGRSVLELVIGRPRGSGGGKESLVLTHAVINFKGVSLRVNENNPDAWPEASRPSPSTAPFGRSRDVEDCRESHISAESSSHQFPGAPARGEDRRVWGKGVRPHILGTEVS